MTLEAAKKYLKGQPISSVWRMRSSGDEVVELKYLLENMQDAAELLGRSGDFRVVWSGMQNLPGFTDYGKKIVGMSYGFVKDETFPLDPKIVDVLIGVLQHEMGHVRQGNVWSRQPVAGRRPRGRRVGRKTYDRVTQTQNVVPPSLTEYERRADAILKDVNIDTAMIREHPLRGAYIMRGRQYFAGRPEYVKGLDKIISQDEPLDWHKVSILWSALQIYYNNTVIHRLTNRPDFLPLAEVLGKLNELSIAAGQLAIDDPLDNEKLKKLVQEAGRLFQEYDQRQSHAAGQPQAKGQQLMSGQGTPGGGKPQEGDENEGQEAQAQGGGQGEDEEQQDGEQPPPSGAEQDKTDEQDGSPEGEDSQEDSLDDDPFGEDTDGEEQGESQQSGCLMGLDTGNTQMPKDLAEQVFRAVEQEVEDVTDRAGMNTFQDGAMIMRRAGVDHERIKSVTEGRVGELQESINILNEVATQRTLGTKHGSLSEQLLWKLNTGEDNVFERTNVLSEVSLRLGLVVDGSSSIDPHQWQIMLDTIDAFIEAFGHRHDIDLLVFVYRGNEIDRVWEPGFEQPCLFGLRPASSTPTLPALKMMLERMDETCQSRQRTIILSVTDGDPNTGGYETDVRDWVTDVQQEHEDSLQIVGVGVGIPERKMEAQYDRWMTVASFEELPGQLKELMLQILLEG